MDAGKPGQHAPRENGGRRASTPLPAMSAKAERLSHDLLSRVVRARDVLFWDVEQTSEALGLTTWRVKDVLRRHDAGDSALCASGVHLKRDRATTKLTVSVRLFLLNLVQATPKTYADELAYRLFAALGTGGARPVDGAIISKALRDMGLTHKLVRACPRLRQTASAQRCPRRRPPTPSPCARASERSSGGPSRPSTGRTNLWPRTRRTACVRGAALMRWRSPPASCRARSTERLASGYTATRCGGVAAMSARWMCGERGLQSFL